VFSVVDPMDPPLQNERPHGSSHRCFRIVDVVSGATLVEDASTRGTVHALGSVESIFDVWIYVWLPEPAAWRQLTPGEHRMLWDFRGR
jgi:hypothetical protein